MNFAAAPCAQKCTIVTYNSKKLEQQRSKCRCGVVRAQSEKPKTEESAAVLSVPTPSGNSVPVLDKSDIKLPSPDVNVIPISRRVCCFRSCSCIVLCGLPLSSLIRKRVRSLDGIIYFYAAKRQIFQSQPPAYHSVSIASFRWPTGIPPAMGGHYLTSGSIAPLSHSKGPGIDIDPLYFTYPSVESSQVDVTIYENDVAAANGLADLVAKASLESIASRGNFVIALSGGSLVKTLGSLVGRTDVDFSRWWVVFVDERVVPLSSPDSNYRGAAENLLKKVQIPSSHVLSIKEGLPVNQTAEHYAGQMLDLATDVLPRTTGNLPIIDLVLLGVGPDGHVASLFPNRKEISATEGWVLPVTESPKPPAERITLTMPVLNAAKLVAVVALGEGKAEIVHRALEVQSLPGALPVQLVHPAGGRVSWVLDKNAASSLAVADWENAKKFPRST